MFLFSRLPSFNRGDGKQWNVFYHFVGALPGSTSLQTTLQRLLKEINLVTVSL